MTNSARRRMKPVISELTDNTRRGSHIVWEPFVCIIIQFNRRFNPRLILMSAISLIIPSEKEH